MIIQIKPGASLPRYRSGELTAVAARAKLEAIAQNPQRYPGWLADSAVGMACAS